MKNKLSTCYKHLFILVNNVSYVQKYSGVQKS